MFDSDTVIVGIGLLVNLAVLLGVAMRHESRMTRLEVLVNILIQRQGWTTRADDQRAKWSAKNG
jgi:hypothetical protein